MSPFSLVLNTLADLCPHGMLPLSYGVASFAHGGPNGLATSAVTLCGFAGLGLYGLISIGRAAEERGRAGMGDSLSGVWDDVMTHNTKNEGERNMGSVMVDFCCFGLTVGCCLFYSAFIGDLFGKLLSGFIPRSFPKILSKRAAILVMVSLSPILPLCLLEDLEALKTSSMVGLCGILYTILFIAKRFFDKSYSSGGKFYGLMQEVRHLNDAKTPLRNPTAPPSACSPFRPSSLLTPFLCRTCEASLQHTRRQQWLASAK